MISLKLGCRENLQEVLVRHERDLVFFKRSQVLFELGDSFIHVTLCLIVLRVDLTEDFQDGRHVNFAVVTGLSALEQALFSGLSHVPHEVEIVVLLGAVGSFNSRQQLRWQLRK